MKLKKLNLSLVFFLCFVSLIFYQCESEDNVLVSSDKESCVTYELSSSLLNDFLKDDRAEITHLIVSIKDGIPRFQKAVQNKKGLLMDDQLITLNGNIKSINGGTQLQYWKEDFEYTSFSIVEIENILTNSEKITFAGSQLQDSEDDTNQYFNLTMNGDLKFSDGAQERGSADGLPCPQYCGG